MKTVNIPDSVSRIGGVAFGDCTSLERIIIPASVTTISPSAFSGCKNLTIYCYKDSAAHQYAMEQKFPFVLLDEISLHTVTFDSQGGLAGGSEIPAQSVPEGECATIPVEPSREGYIFQGWYTDPACTVPYQFDEPVTQNITLYAGWDEDWEYFSTVENVIMATGYGNQKTANVPAEWNDAWFTQPATTYNHKLATTAAILSGAVYVDNASGDKGSGSIESALEKFGFDKILPYDFNYAYTDLPVFCDDGAVSFCLAVKEIENKPESGPKYLLAIIVQGTTGSFIDGEWLNNLCMGLGTEHSGFLAASTRLIEVLADYSDILREQGYLLSADNTKFFLTGHSRGAATANLIAAQLSKRMGSDNVYAYTFATPTVSKAAQTNEYENIFNIVNADDLVPKLPPTWLGYSRYGIDLVLPSRSYYGKGFDTVYQKMNRQFNALTGEDYLEEGSMIHADKWVGLTKDIMTAEDGVGTVVTVIDAIQLLDQYMQDFTQAHSMALYYSWMDTCTPNELFTKATSFKRVNVACPVDVYVYDESNNIVASVVNEQVDANILAVSVENGEKTIDLPSDQEYSIKIVAREDGIVNYTVNELSIETTGDSVLRTVEFYDIEIAAKDTLTGEVNSTLYTDAKNYALNRNEEEEVIYPDSDSLDSTPSNPDDETDAPSAPGNSGTSSNPSYQITVPSISNGTVTVTPKSAKSGEKVTITATPDDGYTIGSVTVTDSSGKNVSVTDNGDGTYTFTMPASQVTVSVKFIPLGTWVNPFTDVSESDWFYEYVAYVVQNGLMSGVGNGRFDPGGTTTRGMVMTILARLAGVNTSDSNPWYQMGMEWAMEVGVSDGTDPEVNITREQLATMLWRYAGEPAVTGDLSAYPDVGDVHADWAGTALIWAVENGIINGSDGKLNPQGNALRSEAAAMLTRYCRNIKK